MTAQDDLKYGQMERELSYTMCKGSREQLQDVFEEEKINKKREK